MGLARTLGGGNGLLLLKRATQTMIEALWLFVKSRQGACVNSLGFGLAVVILSGIYLRGESSSAAQIARLVDILNRCQDLPADDSQLAPVIEHLAAHQYNPFSTIEDSRTLLLKPEAAPDKILANLNSFPWHEEKAQRVDQFLDQVSKLSYQEATSFSSQEIFSFFPQTYECNKNHMWSVGGESHNDGSYWVCMDRWDTFNDCNIISLGTKGMFQWELDMLKWTERRCNIHVFDCNGNFVSPDPKIKVHKACAGYDKTVDGKVFKSWGTIMSELKIKRLSYLKVSIDGYEWMVLREILTNSKILPQQMAVEVHIGRQPVGTDSSLMPIKTDAGMDHLHPSINLFRLIRSAGFFVGLKKTSREPDSEIITFLRDGYWTTMISSLQVSCSPHSDIDAFTGIGNDEMKTVPVNIERWLNAKEQAALGPSPQSNYDVDQMVQLGQTMQPHEKKKGFDFADMVQVAHERSRRRSGSQFDDHHSLVPLAGGSTDLLQRRNSFPPHPAALRNFAAPSSALRGLNADQLAFGDPSRTERNRSSGDIHADFLLMPATAHNDFDDITKNADPTSLIMLIDSAKKREKVKEVLEDIEDYIAKRPVKRQSLCPKVDVDQLLDISKGEHDELSDDGIKSPKSPRSPFFQRSPVSGKSRANSIFSKSRRGSFLQALLPTFSQVSLVKINPAATEDIDEQNAVYYPWTVEGANAEDISKLLEVPAEFKQQNTKYSSAESVSRHDFDTIVLVGSDEKLNLQPSMSISVSNLNKSSTRETPISCPSPIRYSIGTPVYRSAPIINKTVNFAVPEERSVRSSSCDADISSLSQGPVKLDIDHLFNMANSEPVQKLTEINNGPRDFTELVNLAETAQINAVGGTSVAKSLSARASVAMWHERGLKVLSEGSVVENQLDRVGFVLSDNAEVVSNVAVPNGDVDVLLALT
ncbi:hypothetical protein HDU83_001703 [Entophlyctis luteolus]|nr:hypothetical protein HDU83_001703 [Entophlyctis luteolus]